MYFAADVGFVREDNRYLLMPFTSVPRNNVVGDAQQLLPSNIFTNNFYLTNMSFPILETAVLKKMLISVGANSPNDVEFSMSFNIRAGKTPSDALNIINNIIHTENILFNIGDDFKNKFVNLDIEISGISYLMIELNSVPGINTSSSQVWTSVNLFFN